MTHTGRSWRPAVGRKFHRDGSARSFPGSSLVSALEPASSQVRLLQQVQRACRAERFGDRFTYLPTDSFHVTAFDLICDQVREAPHWSARLPLDTPLAETDRAIQGWLRDVEPWPDRLAMRFDRLGPVQTTLHAQLEPADPATADALASFRDRVAEATGVRHPTHDHYRFHVSLAYLLVDLEPEEQRAWERFRARIDADLQRRFDGLTLPSPRLVFFDTMCAFPERRGG